MSSRCLSFLHLRSSCGLLRQPHLLLSAYRAQTLNGPRPCSSHSKGQQPEDMEHLQKNPYYAKYAEKMKQMEGAKPEDFKARLTELEEKKLAELREAQKLREEAVQEAAASQTRPKSLKSVMKLELLQDKTAEEIAEIWKEYHKEKPFVFAVIPSHEYKDMHERLLKFSTFLYPLPRGKGYEFFMQQFSAHSLHFTPLIQYQTQKENAPTCLSLTHYTELMEDKEIVLMHGEPDTKILSINEAQLLTLQVKMYYGMNSGLKFNLVRTFNNTPESFRHMDVIREFEKYKQDSKDFRDGLF